MSKEPFFEEKRADRECLEDFGSAKRGEIKISCFIYPAILQT
jgi:hypothetical protein